MLQPARRKYRKDHKGRNYGMATRGARGVLGSVPLIIGGVILAILPYVNGAGWQIAFLVFGSGLCGSIYVVCPPMLGAKYTVTNFVPASPSRRASRQLCP